MAAPAAGEVAAEAAAGRAVLRLMVSGILRAG